MSHNVNLDHPSLNVANVFPISQVYIICLATLILLPNGNWKVPDGMAFNGVLFILFFSHKLVI